jgi:hypothetical protein
MGTREETTAVEWAFNQVQIFLAFQFPTKFTVTFCLKKSAAEHNQRHCKQKWAKETHRKLVSRYEQKYRRESCKGRKKREKTNQLN